MSGRPEPSWAWLDADTAIRCAEESLAERAAGLGGQSADWWVGHHEATIRSLCAVLRREAAGIKGAGDMLKQNMAAGAAARSQAPSSKAGPVPPSGPADEDDDSPFARAFRAEMAKVVMLAVSTFDAVGGLIIGTIGASAATAAEAPDEPPC